VSQDTISINIYELKNIMFSFLIINIISKNIHLKGRLGKNT